MKKWNQNKFFKRKSKSINAPLIITSLVDAFTILVIFLIYNIGYEPPFEVHPKISLPKTNVASMAQQSPVISIVNGQYIFNKTTLELAALKKYIGNIRRVTLEIDRKESYSKIEPLMRVLAELQIQDIQLAVHSEELL